MNQFDSNGWTNIHSAAFKGFNSILEKSINADKDKLELTTNDELRSTPLLLAVMSGKLETVKELIQLGSQIHARNSQGHGIIEIACLRKDMTLLKYFLDNIEEDLLPVWNQLVDFVGSRDEEESSRASLGICQLFISEITQKEKIFYENKCIVAGLCPTVIKVIKNKYGFNCMKQALLALMQVIRYQTVREEFMKDMGFESLLRFIQFQSTPELVKISVQILDILIAEPNGYSEQIFHSGVLSFLNKILSFATNAIEEKEYENKEDDDEKDQKLESAKQLKYLWQKQDVLKEIVQFIGHLAEINQTFQSSIGLEPSFLKRISSLFLIVDQRFLLLALTNTVCNIVTNNEANQNIFMAEMVEDSIINLTKVKDQAIQLAAVGAIYKLSQGNKDYQLQLMSKNAHKPLLMMLKKSGRNILINENTSLALWSLAGDALESKAHMAHYIGLDTLIDFLQMSSSTLQLIGSEGIHVLSGGPLSQRDVIAKKNGVPPLVNLLKSNNRNIVLSCIKSLRHLCVGIGYIPYQRNQQLVMITRGLQMLVSLMRSCEDELVQVEAAYTIASVCLRNDEALVELHNNPNFNYVYILEKMYSDNNEVRLLASASLAAFAYNNLAEQKQIAMCGGIRFKALQPFLFVNAEKERLMSAFQLIVLARVIPDEELAISTALGIKVLIETLGKTTNSEIQELGCDCVARLCHTRAGVVNGLISLGIIGLLCDFMLSYTESVRGSAAISVEYLSHYPESRRQILRKCRKDPYLMKVITFYKTRSTIDPEFIESWRHYKKVGLPKIGIHRPQLTARMDIDLFKDFDARQITLFDSTNNSIELGSMTERSILPKLPKIKGKSNGSPITPVDDTLIEYEIPKNSTDSMQSEIKNISFHMEETELLIE